MRRIVVDLSAYFNSYAKKAYILLKPEIKTIEDVILRISELFDIQNFCLICNDEIYLPPKEDIDIISNDDILRVVPNKYSKNKENTKSSSNKNESKDTYKNKKNKNDSKLNAVVDNVKSDSYLSFQEQFEDCEGKTSSLKRKKKKHKIQTISTDVSEPEKISETRKKRKKNHDTINNNLNHDTYTLEDKMENKSVSLHTSLNLEAKNFDLKEENIPKQKLSWGTLPLPHKTNHVPIKKIKLDHAQDATFIKEAKNKYYSSKLIKNWISDTDNFQCDVNNENNSKIEVETSGSDDKKVQTICMQAPLKELKNNDEKLKSNENSEKMADELKTFSVNNEDQNNSKKNISNNKINSQSKYYLNEENLNKFNGFVAENNSSKKSDVEDSLQITEKTFEKSDCVKMQNVNECKKKFNVTYNIQAPNENTFDSMKYESIENTSNKVMLNESNKSKEECIENAEQSNLSENNELKQKKQQLQNLLENLLDLESNKSDNKSKADNTLELNQSLDDTKLLNESSQLNDTSINVTSDKSIENGIKNGSLKMCGRRYSQKAYSGVSSLLNQLREINTTESIDTSVENDLSNSQNIDDISEESLGGNKRYRKRYRKRVPKVVTPFAYKFNEYKNKTPIHIFNDSDSDARKHIRFEECSEQELEEKETEKQDCDKNVKNLIGDNKTNQNEINLENSEQLNFENKDKNSINILQNISVDAFLLKLKMNGK